MKSKTDNETVKVHLTAEETFNAGRAAQVQGVATLGEFARRAMLEAAAMVLEPVQGDARLRETGEPGPASAWRVASEAPATRKGVTV